MNINKIVQYLRLVSNAVKIFMSDQPLFFTYSGFLTSLDVLYSIYYITLYHIHAHKISTITITTTSTDAKIIYCLDFRYHQFFS